MKNDWMTQPLYYYLTIGFERFAPSQYGRYLDMIGPERRVWVIFWEIDEPPPDMLEPLNGHRVTRRVQKREASAWLYEPE